MSWFDKLFGEDNNDNEDYLNKRSQRRQKAIKQDNRDSLLPQNNDVYERPKGKFRFPMRVLEEANETNHSEDTISKDRTEQTNSYDERRTSDALNVNHKQRRRRQLYDKNASSEESTKELTPKVEKETYSEPKREAKSHTGQRMRIQTDVLRANANKKNKNTTPKYHESDFKASEVPSAIFGTQEPHPLDNGVIKPLDEQQNVDKEEPSKSESNISQSEAQTENTKNYNDQFIETHKNDQNISMDDEQQYSLEDKGNIDENEKTTSTEDVTERTEDTTLTEQDDVQSTNSSKQPKINNTINIENIYASQIVEEIRRERERKVIQKRQFKKALQQKRQENQDNNEDSIQQAIDEMYAKQAHRYIGESSLDEDRRAKNVSDKQTETSLQDAQKPGKDEPQNEPDTETTSPYNYEEINLDNVSDVHTINDEYVDITTESHDNNNPNDISEDYHALNNDNAHSSNQTDNEESKYSDEEISDAQYREVTNSSEPATKIDSSETEYAIDSKSESEVSTTRSSLNNNGSDTQQHDSAMETSTDDTITQEVSGNDVQADATHLEHQTDNPTEAEEIVSAQKDAEVGELSKSESTTVQSDDLSKAQESKVSIRKGSKPFNVVMTPSDKKRMMDAKKINSSRFSNLNHTKESSKQENSTTEFEQPQVPLESTSENNNQDLESQNRISNHSASTSAVETNDNDQDTDDVSEQSQNSENVVQSASVEKERKRTQARANNTDGVNVSQKDQNHEPILKPEINEVQSNSTTSTETNSKPTIRKGPNIKLPNLDLLEAPEQHEIDNAWIEDKKQELNEAFYYFNVPAEVQNVTEGPSVTRFELSVEKGVKVSRITALQDDIKMALAAKDIRIEAPIPGTSLVGIEVPNQSSTTVNLRSIIEDPVFKNAESKLTVAMGLRINNEPLLMDISKTPHALIAGATGSGKSVCINSILMSLLYKNHPEELKLLLIDPKMVELAPYNDLPHLVAPVITDVKAATQSLKWAVEEMERRYKVFAKYHVRNITAFNKKASYEDRMPKIVIVIDELADLMMMAPQEVEQSIARIAQKARACGIHMLVATQRPSVNVITGLIKANIPTRIAFMVSSSVDSRTILDSGGAERLLGYGDMLYLGSGMNKPIRVQGTFISDEEIDDVVDFIKQQRDPEYLFEEKELLKKTEAQPQDSLFDDVCRFMLQEGHISTSLIQRHFQIGYNRAARIVDQLEQLGYISAANGSKPRDVYITESDLNES